MDVTETQIKAAYLFKFIGYVEWPPPAFQNPDSPLVVGVMNADAVADNLAQVIADRHVAGRPVISKKLRRGDPLTGIHALFIGRAENGRLGDLLASVSGEPLLTITETEAISPTVGIINFAIVDDKVRFDISLRPAERGNLKISARLLAVARKVIVGPT